MAEAKWSLWEVEIAAARSGGITARAARGKQANRSSAGQLPRRSRMGRVKSRASGGREAGIANRERPIGRSPTRPRKSVVTDVARGVESHRLMDAGADGRIVDTAARPAGGVFPIRPQRIGLAFAGRNAGSHERARQARARHFVPFVNQPALATGTNTRK